jgi:hypothetical protein
MKDTSDSKYEARSSIGTGVSLGAAIGAFLASLITQSSLGVVIGSAIGAGLGAAVGTRIKSQMPQFLWIEYPRSVTRRLIFSGVPFLALILGSVYLIKAGTNQITLVVFISAASVSGFILTYQVGKVISQLDDVLRSILLEAIGLGFGLAASIFMTVGLFSLVYPILSNWLVAFIIMLFSMLVGRLVVAWKYR